MKGLFVTGTGTGVGKTLLTGTLVAALRKQGVNAVALKPFASGIHTETHWRDNDPLILAAAAGYVEPPEVVSPVQLKQPLSPYDAARAANCTLDVDTLIRLTMQTAGKYDIALIEGVGGVYAPITDEILAVHLAVKLGLQALVVSRTDLGTINHTLLTVEALRHHQVPVAGIVFSQQSSGPVSLDQEVGPDTACRFARTACFGILPHVSGVSGADSLEDAIAALPIHETAIQAVLEILT